MRRFFVPEGAVKGGSVFIEGADAHHISNVLRMKPGEKLSVCTEDGTEYICVLKSIGDPVEARIEDLCRAASELPARITLFQCLPKKDKMELVIQKSVELGVFRIVPVISERTVSRPDEKKCADRVKRWNAIARNAAEQSKRSVIPEVSMPVDFEQAMALSAENDLNLMPYEHASGMEHTRSVMHSLKGLESIGVIIGPEGGFSEREVGKCRETGFEIVTLGKRILRTETAGIAVLSILMYCLEE